MINNRELLNKILKQLRVLSQPEVPESKLKELADKFDNYDDSSDNHHYNFWDGIETSKAYTSLSAITFLKEHFDVDMNDSDIDRELLSKALKKLIHLAIPESSESELQERVDRMVNYKDHPTRVPYNFWEGSSSQDAHMAQTIRIFLKKDLEIDICNPDIDASFKLLEFNPDYYKLIKIVNEIDYQDTLNKLNAKAKILKEIG